MGIKNSIICYDVVLRPEGWDFDKLFYIAREYGYLLYDSWNQSVVNPPYMLNPNEEMTKILVDISTEKGKKIVKEIEDGEANR